MKKMLNLNLEVLKELADSEKSGVVGGASAISSGSTRNIITASGGKVVSTGSI